MESGRADAGQDSSQRLILLCGRGHENKICVLLTGSRIGNHARLIANLPNVMTTHTH